MRNGARLPGIAEDPPPVRLAERIVLVFLVGAAWREALRSVGTAPGIAVLLEIQPSNRGHATLALSRLALLDSHN